MSNGVNMRSSIVVTSWWSNCLALTALHRLVECAPGRELYVIQAGKTDIQMDRFRRFLPKHVRELHYPSHLLADDSPMREYLVREALRNSEGVWFVDHDTFITASAVPWLETADRLLEKSNICLCTREPFPGSGVTQPAYWTSPKRWPQGLSSFDPVPFKAKPYSRRPDLYRHDGHLTLPLKDTLVQIREELDAMRMAGALLFDHNGTGDYLLPVFPRHQHIGGLHLYTGPVHPPSSMPQAFFEWRRYVVSNFERFFTGCPKEWIDHEEPELLRRHRELRDVVMRG
jgi:hypothetical protein